MRGIFSFFVAIVLSQLVFAQSIPAQYFGMHQNHVTTKDPWAAVSFGSLRLWDDATTWQQTNIASGSYSWTNIDRWLTLMGQHGVLDAVYELGGTPQWASSAPSDTTCDHAGKGTDGYCDPPSDLASDGSGPDLIWRTWVAAVARHFQNASSGVHVAAYEIWNEFSRQPGNPVGSSFAWRGTNAQMVRLAQDARCIITGRGSILATGETCAQVWTTIGLDAPVDPTALMLTPSAGVVPGSIGLKFFKSYLSSPGADITSEGLAIHPYAIAGAAESSYNHIARFQAGLSSTDRAKPLWSTEGGWVTDIDLPDPDMQAAFVARYYLLLWSVGAARNYWYMYDNSKWGTLWNTSGLTKAGTAYQQTYNWLVSNRMTQPCTEAGTVWTCGLTKPDGTSMRAVWDSSQTCSKGTCTTTNYNAAGYDTYYTLADGSGIPIDGGAVAIGAKPILLVNSVLPPTDLVGTVD